MQKTILSAIVAIGKNRELGRKNELIWRISEDLKRVKALTMGHPLIMGRKTYESIGKPLPGRTNIIVSRSIKVIEGCIVVASLADALQEAHRRDHEEIFIFGGASLYSEALPHIDRLYVTHIDAENKDADIFFPPFEQDFIAGNAEHHQTPGGLSYSWVTYTRRSEKIV